MFQMGFNLLTPHPLHPFTPPQIEKLNIIIVVTLRYFFNEAFVRYQGHCESCQLQSHETHISRRGRCTGTNRSQGNNYCQTSSRSIHSLLNKKSLVYKALRLKKGRFRLDVVQF